MARLPDSEWLHLAKRLAVGTRTRVFHRREGRPNLVIGNEAGKWWAYCQSCKAGAVVEKDHVRITGGKAPESSTHLDLPRDSTPILELDEFSRDAVLRLLASKCMDQVYLPPLYFSEQRKRMLLDTGQGWLGRDTTGASPQKWLTYDGSLYLGPDPVRESVAIVVEDPFSYYKVQWALRELPDVSVYCALGTVLRPVLRLALTQCESVVCFFDGDPPGIVGGKREAKALRGLGVRAIARPAPDGFDPKDLTIDAIRSYANGL
ncbi:DNA primase [Pseudomonas phage Bertil]|uniref:DNA primase n=1 Tax=Pseudomonas phage Bertil TaxID=2801385 RepID=A0A7T8IW35_9CAUD|nr:DNA primase [Pseudomonas phage Bertil]QQO90883.1 DNA primase [Pseudomonas phage Strit]